MTRDVRVTDKAQEDLRRIGFYIAEHESISRSLDVVDQIETRISSLVQFPERGSYVNELLDQRVRRHRQVMSGPYRIVYTVTNAEVIVHLIADGRRDMRTLLLRRLLGA